METKEEESTGVTFIDKNIFEVLEAKNVRYAVVVAKTIFGRDCFIIIHKEEKEKVKGHFFHDYGSHRKVLERSIAGEEVRSFRGLIGANKLYLAHKNEDGHIYEVVGRPFREEPQKKRRKLTKTK